MMKKAAMGIQTKPKAKPLPPAGKQTPADFYPESYDKLPRTKSGGANYNGPKAGPRKMDPKGMSKNGSMMKKAKDGSAFAKLAPPYDKATFADKIAGATKGKAKSGTKMKKAMMGVDMMQSPMMKKGGSVKKCKYGCK